MKPRPMSEQRIRPIPKEEDFTTDEIRRLRMVYRVLFEKLSVVAVARMCKELDFALHEGPDSVERVLNAGCESPLEIEAWEKLIHCAALRDVTVTYMMTEAMRLIGRV